MNHARPSDAPAGALTAGSRRRTFLRTLAITGTALTSLGGVAGLEFLQRATLAQAAVPAVADAPGQAAASRRSTRHHPAVTGTSPKLARFVESLLIPPSIQPTGRIGSEPRYDVRMTEFRHSFHPSLPPTRVWGYANHVPGPMFEVSAGSAIHVRWVNDLPRRHLLTIDPAMHGAEPPTPAVRSVVHLHGGHTPAASDGYPEAWFEPGDSALYTYPNNQQASLLWYHDHTLGISRLNVYAGLAGLYVIRDNHEAQLGLPRGRYEVPLLLQDKTFNADGSLFYPAPTSPPTPEFFGDVPVINGKAFPYLEVEPRRYRLRIVNGSNARFYRLSLSSGQVFQQIGTDGGLLKAPVPVKQLLLAPAERADVVVDFASQAGRSLLLENDAPAPFPGGGDISVPVLMQFRVQAGRVPDPSQVPDALAPTSVAGYPGPLDDSPVAGPTTTMRDITLQEFEDGDENPLFLLLNGVHWDAPVTEQPSLNASEVWRFLNLTDDAHPMHIHLVQFRILDRQPFDVETYRRDTRLRFTGPSRAPEPNEMGWKDTVVAHPGEATRVGMRFADYTGRFVYHCHILEHEENDMMRPFDVVAR